MEQTGCSETSAYKIQTPGNYPEESIQQVLNYNNHVVKQNNELPYLSTTCMKEASFN